MSAVTAAVVAAVATVGSAAIASDASRKAANTQADAALNAQRMASNTQLQMFEEGRADTAPWRKTGEEALNILAEKVKAGPGEYVQSPGYVARYTAGENALDRSLAAKSGVLSGKAVKAGIRYGQDYATNDYQNFLANYYNSLTPLQSLSGQALTTAGNNAAAGNQVASNIAQGSTNAMNLAAQAQAGNAINQSNVITGAVNSGINNYLMWKYLNQTPQSDYSSDLTRPAGSMD